MMSRCSERQRVRNWKTGGGGIRGRREEEDLNEISSRVTFVDREYDNSWSVLKITYFLTNGPPLLKLDRK